MIDLGIKFGPTLPRINGVVPFAILDGHGSRFDLTFLQYINDPVTKWYVDIGVPYGIVFWKVGDSKEKMVLLI